MTSQVIVDTGPVVALLNRRDPFHSWARERATELNGPMRTCEAVLSEVSFLLRRAQVDISGLAKLVDRGALVPALSVRDNASAIFRAMSKYADTPMSFADACLVRMAELDEDAVVWTLDSDFTVYRKHGDKPVRLIAPSRR